MFLLNLSLVCSNYKSMILRQLCRIDQTQTERMLPIQGFFKLKDQFVSRARDIAAPTGDGGLYEKQRVGHKPTLKGGTKTGRIVGQCGRAIVVSCDGRFETRAAGPTVADVITRYALTCRGMHFFSLICSCRSQLSWLLNRLCFWPSTHMQSRHSS